MFHFPKWLLTKYFLLYHHISVSLASRTGGSKKSARWVKGLNICWSWINAGLEEKAEEEAGLEKNKWR